MDFLSTDGLENAKRNQSALGSVQQGVSLTTGGVVTGIVPSRMVEFGVRSQALAYARSRGRSTAGDTFLPQPRPPALGSASVTRPHECAGLVSIPTKGLGYGGSGFENDDECFESTFLVTNSALLELDKKRLVVGQVLDETSMSFLERLASLPTKRGIRGVIPGQTSGPPLPKVAVKQIQVAKVTRKSG